METRLLAALILSPFVAAIIYAGIHEYRRYRSEGPATYGLVYDEKTGTTHVTGIGEDQDSYDPEDFDPSNYTKPESEAEDEEKNT